MDARLTEGAAAAPWRGCCCCSFLQMNAMMMEMNAETMATVSVYTVMSMLLLLLLLREARRHSRIGIARRVSSTIL